MAYTHYQNNKPSIADAGATVIDDIRENLDALRDAIVAGAALNGWALTVTNGSGTAAQPQFLTYANGVLRVRLTITWGSAGGSAGNPTAVLYEFSGNSGSSYDSMGTLNTSYDASGNVTGTTWS